MSVWTQLAELVKGFGRLHRSEAKWMIRLLLKDLRPVEMPEAVTLLCFHFLLPDLPKVRNSLPAALDVRGTKVGQALWTISSATKIATHHTPTKSHQCLRAKEIDRLESV